MKKKSILIILIIFIIGLAGIYLFYKGDFQQEPLGESDIQGEIVSIDNGHILVAEDYKGETWSGELETLEGKAIKFAVDEKTAIIMNGENKPRSFLEVGQSMEGWARGVIMESHPERAEAARIEIEK